MEQVFDGVVGVNTYVMYDGKPVQDGYGSGFVVASEGYIVTNAHVIRGGDKITVTFSDQEEVDAEVVGADSTLDVAVLKVEKGGLTPLALGDSDPVRVGEFTIAIGNPSGTDTTMSVTAIIKLFSSSDTISIALPPPLAIKNFAVSSIKVSAAAA